VGVATKPKFGGVFDGRVVWIGGPPNHDWSDTHAAEMASPQCLRGLDPKTHVYMYKDRALNGNEIKFKKDDKEYTLLSFANDALEHMKTHGMDTVFYMKPVADGTPDDEDTGAMELFTYHSRFTKSAVADAVAGRIDDGTFDIYAKDALKESGRWLKESLDQSLKTTMRSSLAKAHTGPDVWMLIVSEVQSSAIQRCEVLIDKFKATKLSDFPGENVEMYCATVDDYLSQLETEGELPSNHLITITEALVDCSVLEFKMEMVALKSRVIKFKRESTGKDPAIVAGLTDRITYSDVLAEAKMHYMDMSKKWGPAKDAKVNQAETVLSKMQGLLSKVESKLNNSPASTATKQPRKFPGKTCNGCGAKDMIKPRCPKCKSKGKSDSPAPAASTSTKPKDPKWAAPKDGEPKSKEIDGVLRHYCSKCFRGQGMWSKTHGTDQHVDNFKAKQAGEANVGKMDLSTIQIDALNADQKAKLHQFLALV